MATNRQRFKQVGTNRTYQVEYETEPIGQGGQGKVYKIVRVNNTLCATWVIKILDDTSPQLVKRLQALIDFIQAHSLNTDGLSCVPTTVLQATSGQIGIPMRFAEATDLENGGGLPRNSTLPKRLALAYELARSVRRLHNKGMVIGDLAHDNLIVFPENWALYLIDLDGAKFKWQGQTHLLLANNSPKGSICPPEFSSKMDYTATMDLWSMAVLLHYFLTDQDPISLFGLARSYATTQNLTWPPSNHPKGQEHLEALRLFGEPLKNAFIKTFNEGRLKPRKRLKAQEWGRLLAQAQTYMYQCYSEPNKPFVALNNDGKMLMECPNICANCPKPIMARP